MEITARSEAVNKSWFDAAFSELPSIVRKDPYRIGLVPAAVWQRFLSLAPAGGAEFWVAVSDDKKVRGRIGANLFASHPETGGIGFFEVDLDDVDPKAVARALLDAAGKWLQARRVKRQVGPIALNTWFPYRFRTDGDERAFAWEPINPPEYPDLFLDNGFQLLQEYHSVGTSGLATYVEKTSLAYRKALDAGFTFRPFDQAQIMEREVPVLYRISMDGFRDNYLFEPIPLEAFRELYVPIAKKLDFSLSHFAVSPQGEEIGFFFCYQEGDSLVFKSMTIDSRFRGQGISNALSHLSGKEALRRGATGYISALMRKGAQSESYMKKGGFLWEHRYALYVKE